MRAAVMIFGLAMVASFGATSARGGAPLVATPAHTIAIDRAAWASSIASARLRSPATFTTVGAVRGQLARLDRDKRGPLAPIPAQLQGLGKDSVEALVEQLLLPTDPTLTDTAVTAWRAGLLETLASLRDPRVRDVAASLLDDADRHVARAAALAIAKLGDDESVTILAPRIRALQPGAIGGAGACRRRGIASALAAAVSAHPSRELARVTAKALADLGSAWAWKTGKVPAPGEEADVRAIAARALLDLFVGYDGDVRVAVANAILVVDDPSTAALIASAKLSASSDTIAALDALSVRLARNPAR